MASYKYVAKDQNGNTMTGVLDVKDRVELVDTLRKKDLIIISVKEAQSKFEFRLLAKKKIKLDDIVIFARQLATMVDAGIPLVGILDILGEQSEDKYFGEIIKSVRNDVETGSSLSDALARHKEIFSSLFVSMVKSGESSGMLDEILERLAEYMEKTNSLQRKVRSALVYPAIVSTMAFAITFLLLWKVVPVFKTIFEGFGAQLPVPTMILIAISEFLQRYIIFVIGGLIGSGILVKWYISTEGGRMLFDSILLKLPVFGILLRKVAISKFTRTLSTLIKAGVPILSALEIVGKTSGSKVVEAAIDAVRSNVREGAGISEPLTKTKIFPPMVTRMVSVGEQAGELEKMLSKISDFYDEQVDAAVTGLTSLIEPLIIAFLGIVIGSIVICMFLPIFRITTVLGL